MLWNLLHPTKPKYLGKWVISNFLKIYHRNNGQTEKEIAQTLFNKRYNSIFIPKDLKKVANSNYEFVESIPDLLFCIINMESKGGRTKKFKDLYLEGLQEMIKIYSTGKLIPCELNQIIKTIRKISQVSSNSSLSAEGQDFFNESLIESLIFSRSYRNLTNEIELLKHLSSIVIGLEEAEEIEKTKNSNGN